MVIVNFRMSDIMFHVIKELAKNNNIYVSDIMRFAVESYVENNFDKINKHLKKDYKEYLRQNEQKKRSLDWKKDSRDGFIILNTIKNIGRMASSSFILHKDINMRLVENQINHARKVYNSMRPNSKKMLKEDMDELDRLKSKSYIAEKFMAVKLLAEK